MRAITFAMLILGMVVLLLGENWPGLCYAGLATMYYTELQTKEKEKYNNGEKS